MGSIRLLLALAVALFHSYGIFSASDVMTGGRVSVQAFYLISGFYMAMILNEKYKPGPGSYRLFITSRFLRIYPAYWACLLIVLLICLAGKIFWDQPFYLYYWTSKWDVLAISSVVIFIFSNLFLLGSDWLVFSRIDPANGHLSFSHSPFVHSPMSFQFLLIPQIWSVGVEISFYLLAPFLLRTRWFIQLALVAASLLLRYYISDVLHWSFDPWTYRFFPAELAFFIGGSLAYKIYLRIKDLDLNKWIPRLLWLTVILAIAFYPRLSFVSESERRWYFYGLFLIALPFVFMLTKNNKFDRFIGELSFPVYIGHHIVMFLWRKYFWANAQYMEWFGIATAVSSLVFGILLWFTIVSPLEKYRRKRVEQKMKTINFTT